MGSPIIGQGRKLREAIRLLHERGLDGLVVYSDGTCNILRASYLRYFAEYAPLGPHAAAVIASSGAVSLLVQPGWDVTRVKRHTWIEDVRGTDDFPNELPATLSRLGVAGQVGLVGGRQMPHPAYEALAGAVRLHASDEIIEFIAAKKSAEELALVHRAAAAADAGFEAFRQWSRVGVREYEIVAQVEYAMRAAGADDNFILISTGPHNRAMRAPTDRRVEKGDVVIGEITPVCEGQFFQLCRTVSVGEPAAALESAYALLLRAYAAAVSRVRSGVPASTVATAIDDVLRDAGFGEFCRPPYMRTRGHGFGIGSVAPGALIDADTHDELIDEQVLVVHPNQYLPDTGYLACGETLLVHPDGAERLAATETRLWVNEA